MSKIYLLLIILLLPTLTLAMPVEDVNLKTFVNDYTQTLIAQDRMDITTILSSMHNSNIAEVAIVMVDNFDDLSKEEYAMTIAHNNLGNEDDNGLLILIGKDIREYRIEVGYGLEGDLNDAKIGRFARDYMVPYLKENNYGEGLKAFTYAIHQELLPNQEIEGIAYTLPNNAKTEFNSHLVYIGFLVMMVAIRAISSKRYQKQTGKKPKDDNKFFWAAIIASSLLRGGRGGGSGGFGGFGGGGFGGGGAGGGF